MKKVIKYNLHVKKIIVLIIFYIISCIIFNISPITAGQNENRALDDLALKLLSKSEKLKGKKICIFKFTSIEGKETEEGAKISQFLLERLIDNDFIKFVDRSELAKIVGEQELAQSGLIDRELTEENSKILPIDLMITGTFARISNKAYISAKVLNANTGELYIVKSVEYDDVEPVMAEKGMERSADQSVIIDRDSEISSEAIALFKNSPEKLEKVNQAYYNLERMSDRRPLLFLMTVLDDREIKMVEDSKPRLAAAIRSRNLQLQREKPDVISKIKNLKRGLVIMKESFPSRYEQIMKKKTEVLNRRSLR